MTKVKIDHNQLCNIRKGVMLYSYKDPDKNEIKRIYDSFINITNTEFKYYFKDEGNYKKINNKNIFYEWIENCTFNSTEILALSDTEKEILQKNKMYFSGSNYNENYVCNLPNLIYLECMCEISWQKIYEFILEANKTGKYYYICSNYVVGINDNLVSRSRVEGIKMLSKSKALNEWTSIWRNFNFLMSMKQGIDGPNFIQVISPQLYKKLEINNLKNDSNIKFRYSLNNENLVIDLVEQDYAIDDERIEESFKQIYLFLKPIILDVKKPKMYWKDETWNKWRTRFDN